MIGINSVFFFLKCSSFLLHFSQLAIEHFLHILLAFSSKQKEHLLKYSIIVFNLFCNSISIILFKEFVDDKSILNTSFINFSLG